MTESESNGLTLEERITDDASDADLSAAAIKYACAVCLENEEEFCCYNVDEVVLVGKEVMCHEHAKGLRSRRVVDVAAKLKRQRGAIAAANRALEKRV